MNIVFIKIIGKLEAVIIIEMQINDDKTRFRVYRAPNTLTKRAPARNTQNISTWQV
jgi:hypothetical protein